MQKDMPPNRSGRSAAVRNVIRAAYSVLGTPYVFGGTSYLWLWLFQVLPNMLLHVQESAFPVCWQPVILWPSDFHERTASGRFDFLFYLWTRCFSLRYLSWRWQIYPCRHQHRRGCGWLRSQVSWGERYYGAAAFYKNITFSRQVFLSAFFMRKRDWKCIYLSLNLI